MALLFTCGILCHSEWKWRFNNFNHIHELYRFVSLCYNMAGWCQCCIGVTNPCLTEALFARPCIQRLTKCLNPCWPRHGVAWRYPTFPPCIRKGDAIIVRNTVLAQNVSCGNNKFCTLLCTVPKENSMLTAIYSQNATRDSVHLSVADLE